MKLRASTVLISLLLFVSSAFAQDPRLAQVERAKADLIAAHQDLTGPCGAFLITNLAATYIGSPAGILSKPSGNNCQEFAVDIIAYPDGHIFDILANAGGDESNGVPIPGTGNVPMWMSLTSVDASRYRKPVETGMDPTPTDPIPNDPNPAIDALSQRVNQVELNAAQTRTDITGLAEYIARLETLLSAAIDRVLVLEGKKVPTSCNAALNLGAARIPVSCKLVP